MGQLRKIDPDTGTTGDIPFEFDVMKDNHNYNQRHYEALGEVNQFLLSLLLLVIILMNYHECFIGNQ